ncbi:hypothetical protein HDV05_007493 [Chytridiales sp. JEL 0842]|nr:hypothetical protein HDV05_007493 [Chytridiales sp. JEL 0842]
MIPRSDSVPDDAAVGKTRFDTQVIKVDPSSFSFPLNSQLISPPNSDGDSPTVTKDLSTLQLAASILTHTSIPVAFPTETVYGLGANALSEPAIKSIFTAKGRPQDNPLIVHVSSISMLESLLPPSHPHLPEIYKPLIDSGLWPGPLTLLVPRGPQVPSLVTASHPTIAVRMPSNPIARKLIELCGFPIAAPSANTSGKPSPTRASHVFQDLNTVIPLIIDGGEAHGGVESTVLDAISFPQPVVLRPGGVTVETLRQFPGFENVKVHKRDFANKELEEAPTTPGMKYRHYSPSVDVLLFESSRKGVTEGLVEAMEREVKDYVSDGRKVGLLRTSERPVNESLRGVVEEHYLGSSLEPAAVAKELFNGLRSLDEKGVGLILVEGISEDNEGLAVMNRLRKAAKKIILV